MTERQKERQSIIISLVGPVEGIGEGRVDKKVLENMDFAEDVILYFIKSLARNAEYKGYEKSRIDIAARSQEILRDIREMMNDQEWEGTVKENAKNTITS